MAYIREKERQQKNEYAVAKGNTETQSRIKFWRLIEYYSALIEVRAEIKQLENKTP